MTNKQEQGASNREWGAFAEQKAAEYLRTIGYVVRETNLRMRNIEIDLIAQKGKVISFVEVKARSGDAQDPAEAVDKKKRNKMIAAADIYLQNQDCDYYWQFDIVTLTGTKDSYTIDYLPDAFYPPCKAGISKKH